MWTACFPPDVRSARHGHVVVTHDAVGLTPHAPKFVPRLGDLAAPAVRCFAEYVRQVQSGQYPAAEHAYDMPPEPLDAAVLFAPVGDLVPPALRALDRGGTLAIAGIYLSDIPSLNYDRELFQERVLLRD